MNSLRSLLALALAAVLSSAAAFAEHHDSKSGEKSVKAACGCATGKDGKECGVDKDCCCSGEKAKGKPADKSAPAPKTK